METLITVSPMTEWRTQEQPGPLPSGEVHLWIASLSSAPERLLSLKSILSADEKERARRFRKTGDSERYTIARGLLRTLLGAYLAVAPERLRFAYNAYGKPLLAEGAHSGALNFSVSHSADLALFGFVREHRIGVDLERINIRIEVERLAERYFSATESQKLSLLPKDQRREAFYCGWTRKEAYLKARGEGLSCELNQVEVSLAPNEPAMLLRVSDEPDAFRKWTIQHLLPAPGYIGAAAVEVGKIAFRCFRRELG